MDALADVKVSYLAEFHRDGVFVFKDLIQPQHIQTLTAEIHRIHALVLAKIRTLERPLRLRSDIAERHPGRLDYRCGFTAEIFSAVSAPIDRLIQSLSPQIDCRKYWGAIPSLSGSGPTDLHRDVYPMLNTSQDYDLDAIDINLPPYYFTVLIPLQDITPESGPTQFVKGSHRQAKVDQRQVDIYAPLLSLGDIVIFDGRTLHRGSANNSPGQRMVAYLTYVANWYHDQTFMINDYLFPELSTPGK